MSDNNNIFKVGLLIILIAGGGPVYMFLDGTVQQKRQNAITNAEKPWAPKELYSASWRHGLVGRGEKQYEVLVEWTLMYGSDALIRALYLVDPAFHARAVELNDYAYDTEHAWSPPRITGEGAQPAIIGSVLYDMAEYLTTKRKENGLARVVLGVALNPELCPNIETETKELLNNFRGRLQNATY